MDALALQERSAQDLLADGSIMVTGDAAALREFMGLLDTCDFWFNIVTP